MFEAISEFASCSAGHKTAPKMSALVRIFHKGRRERPENAVNADSERSETFEEQQKMSRGHIEIFRGLFFVLWRGRHGVFRSCSRPLVRYPGWPEGKFFTGSSINFIAEGYWSLAGSLTCFCVTGIQQLKFPENFQGRNSRFLRQPYVTAS